MKGSETTVDVLERIVVGGVAMTSAALEHATGGLELTVSQWRAILVVGETDEGCRVGEVARRVSVTLPATSRLLRRLERRGLMRLEPDERDRRATRVRLTEDGVRLRAAVLAHRRDQLAVLVGADDVPEAAKEVLSDLARRFEAYGR